LFPYRKQQQIKRDKRKSLGVGVSFFAIIIFNMFSEEVFLYLWELLFQRPNSVTTYNRLNRQSKKEIYPKIMKRIGAFFTLKETDLNLLI